MHPILRNLLTKSKAIINLPLYWQVLDTVQKHFYSSNVLPLEASKSIASILMLRELTCLQYPCL